MDNIEFLRISHTLASTPQADRNLKGLGIEIIIPSQDIRTDIGRKGRMMECDYPARVLHRDLPHIEITVRSANMDGTFTSQKGLRLLN